MQKNINIIKTESYTQMSETCARLIADEINNSNYSKTVLGLATGSTPLGTYKKLADMYKQGAVDFANVTSFNLDEYYPISKNDASSYQAYMHRNLFDFINIDTVNINIPNGEALNSLTECRAYSQKLNTHSIDLQLLGIGMNGHIGFNEPDDKFTSATHLVTLTQSTIEANRTHFQNGKTPPSHAITMGIKEIFRAKKIILIADCTKKSILEKALFSDITPQIPASILQLHKNLTVITVD